jgi:hypothetical protein
LTSDGYRSPVSMCRKWRDQMPVMMCIMSGMMSQTRQKYGSQQRGDSSLMPEHVFRVHLSTYIRIMSKDDTRVPTYKQLVDIT